MKEITRIQTALDFMIAPCFRRIFKLIKRPTFYATSLRRSGTRNVPRRLRNSWKMPGAPLLAGFARGGDSCWVLIKQPRSGERRQPMAQAMGRKQEQTNPVGANESRLVNPYLWL